MIREFTIKLSDNELNSLDRSIHNMERLIEALKEKGANKDLVSEFELTLVFLKEVKQQVATS